MSDLRLDHVVSQMRLMSAQAANTVAPDAAIGTKAAAPGNFSHILEEAIGKVDDLQKKSESLKVAFEENRPDVNLVDVMLASQKSSLAFQGMVQVRNKLVSAYQDIMNMQV